MDAKLPVRLRVLLPIVENAISANAYPSGRRARHAQRTDGRDRQHRCGRSPDPLRCAGARGRRQARSADRCGDADRRGARRARSGVAGAVQHATTRWQSELVRYRPRRIRSAVAHAAVDRLRRRAVEQDRGPQQRLELGIFRAPSSARCSCSGSSPKRAPGCTSICMPGTARSGRAGRSAPNRRRCARCTRSSSTATRADRLDRMSVTTTAAGEPDVARRARSRAADRR